MTTFAERVWWGVAIAVCAAIILAILIAGLAGPDPVPVASKGNAALAVATIPANGSTEEYRRCFRSDDFRYMSAWFAAVRCSRLREQTKNDLRSNDLMALIETKAKSLVGKKVVWDVPIARIDSADTVFLDSLVSVDCAPPLASLTVGNIDQRQRQYAQKFSVSPAYFRPPNSPKWLRTASPGHLARVSGTVESFEFGVETSMIEWGIVFAMSRDDRAYSYPSP